MAVNSGTSASVNSSRRISTGNPSLVPFRSKSAFDFLPYECSQTIAFASATHLLLHTIVVIYPSVIGIILLVSVIHLTQNPARIPNSHSIGWQVLCYHTARPYDHVIANGNAGKNDCPRADPAVFSYLHGSVILIPLFPKLRQNRMTRSGDSDIRAKHSISRPHRYACRPRR